MAGAPVLWRCEAGSGKNDPEWKYFIQPDQRYLWYGTGYPKKIPGVKWKISASADRASAKAWRLWKRPGKGGRRITSYRRIGAVGSDPPWGGPAGILWGCFGADTADERNGGDHPSWKRPDWKDDSGYDADQRKFRKAVSAAMSQHPGGTGTFSGVFKDYAGWQTDSDGYA